MPRATRAVAVVLLVGLSAAACGARRTAEEQAAVRAQDACIAALEPVSKGRPPSAGDLVGAARDADAAAGVAPRWVPLRERVGEYRARSEARETLDALVQECARVNQIVKEKRAEDTPSEASLH